MLGFAYHLCDVHKCWYGIIGHLSEVSYACIFLLVCTGWQEIGGLCSWMCSLYNVSERSYTSVYVFICTCQSRFSTNVSSSIACLLSPFSNLQMRGVKVWSIHLEDPETVRRPERNRTGKFSVDLLTWRFWYWGPTYVPNTDAQHFV